MTTIAHALRLALGLYLAGASLHAAHALEINTASQAELEQLKGIGVAMSERLLIERGKAPIQDWEDLSRRVPGLRGARAKALSDQGLRVGGEPYPARAASAASP
ncbi:MAG TPA: helix-hairpin-helix domain-containing protein [Burkholderiaceae bacterium]|nr:helix-hairpin-helix domain-containing protein [Burkholderiaceae bacterium]